MISQFDKDDVEAVGLVKFDFLGLTTLTILDWAVRYVKLLGETEFDLETIPLDDPASYKLLHGGQHDRGVPVGIARHARPAHARRGPTASRTSSRWWRCTARARWT